MLHTYYGSYEVWCVTGLTVVWSALTLSSCEDHPLVSVGGSCAVSGVCAALSDLSSWPPQVSRHTHTHTCWNIRSVLWVKPPFVRQVWSSQSPVCVEDCRSLVFFSPTHCASERGEREGLLINIDCLISHVYQNWHY